MKEEPNKQYTVTQEQLINLCYSIFRYAVFETNPDDGGAVDWFNDTKPKALEYIEHIGKGKGKANNP